MNEFEHIRLDIAETEKGSAEKSSLLRDVFNSELTSRQFLLEKTISMKDYAQATAQLETERESVASYCELFSPDPSYESFIQKAEHDIKYGLAVQRRDRLMKWAVLGSVLVILLLVSLGIYLIQSEKIKRAQEEEQHAQEMAKREKEEKEKSNLELNKQIQKMIDVARSQHFGQGSLAIESSLIKMPSFCPVAWQKECTLRTSLLPEQCASGTDVIEAVSFSPDERYFIGKTSDNYLTCWQTENGQFVSREKFIAEIPGMDSVAITPNPCFQNSEATTPSASSEFLILTAKGVIIFWNHLGEIEKSGFVDLVKANPEWFSDYDSLSFGRPCFLTHGGSPIMVVGDKQGKISFFSLPDGNLLKQVQGPEKGISALCLSQDQKYLAASGNDGLYRYWKTDGTTAEELELPLSKEPHPEYGFCRPLDISPNGQLLAAGIENGEILVWDLINKKVVAKMQEVANADTIALIIQRVYWLDDSRLVTICPNGHYGIWDLNRRDENGVPESMDLPVKKSLPLMGVRAAVLSPSHQKLLISENNFRLSLFDMQTGKKELASEGLMRFVIQNISLPVAPLWHPGLGRIIVGGYDYDPIRLYDPATMRAETLAPLRNEKQPWVVTGIEPASQGTRFAIALTPLNAPGQGVIQLYEGNPPVLKHKIKSKSDLTFPNQAMSCALSPDGKLLAVMDLPSYDIKVCDWETGKVIQKVSIVGGMPFSFLFNAENQLITFSNHAGLQKHVLKLTRWESDWTVKDGTPINAEELELPEQPSASAMSSDGKLLALGFMNGKVLLLDSRKFSNEKELDFSEPLYSLQNNMADILKMRKSDTLLNTRNMVSGIAWSPNNELMMVSFSSGKSVLVETETFSEVASGYCGEETYHPLDNRAIHPVFVGPDKLFTFSGNGSIHRWNWVSSPEKPVVLWENNGARKIREFKDGMVACLEEYDRKENPFFVFQGNKEVFRIKQIKDFEYCQNGTFLLLKKDGTFMAVNEKGEPSELPDLLKSLPSGEIKTFQVSTDGRWIGIHLNDETVWYADLQAKESSWIQVKVGEENSLNAMCFVADRPEIILLTSQLQMRVWNLEKQEFVKKSTSDKFSQLKDANFVPEARFSPSENTILEFMKNLCLQTTVSQSGKYVFYVSPGNAIGVWSREREEMVQIVSPDVLVSPFERLYMLPLDRGFGEWEKEDAFVVGGVDGILRFYQYIPAEKKFKNVYVVSQLQLADCMVLPELVEDRSAEMFEKDAKGMLQVVKKQQCWIQTLSLSPDGKKLYVGSVENVYSYDMDEIRKNIAGLKEKWEKINTEDLTSLRFGLDSGIESVNRVFLQKK
ncbi:MAG: WD40 repeat domain-containing protein [Thermoguttaceae bacterium]|nr:WD40 repeat domain-containing protein [Thermoguttaceae bacterium]